MHRRPTTQDISWFLDLNANNQLNLDPPYQRRSVWTPKDRRLFLDTIFRGYPCPAVFLNKVVVPGTERTLYEVVDGKQRLQTILLFTKNELAVDTKYGDERLDGKKWHELSDAERRIFWNYVLPVEFLTFTPDDSQTVNLAFERMNRNAQKLLPQEIRHARWDGWFITKAETECEDATWKKLGVVTSARSKRMKDVQYMSELLLVLIEGKQHGFNQDFLDSACAKYDDVEIEDTEIVFDEDVFSDRLETIKTLLSEMDNVSSGVIKKTAGTLQLFYTVWATLVLHIHEFSNVQEFSMRLGRLHTHLSRLRETEDRTTLFAGPQETHYRKAAEVFDALVGASTDLSKREKRLTAFIDYMRLP